jgi:hypothetical protein
VLLNLVEIAGCRSLNLTSHDLLCLSGMVVNVLGDLRGAKKKWITPLTYNSVVTLVLTAQIHVAII